MGPVKALVYSRVSTDAQERACMEYAASRGGCMRRGEFGWEDAIGSSRTVVR
jgi:hypothetical protein